MSVCWMWLYSIQKYKMQVQLKHAGLWVPVPSIIAVVPGSCLEQITQNFPPHQDKEFCNVPAAFGCDSPAIVRWFTGAQQR